MPPQEQLVSITKAAKVIGLNKSTLTRQVKDGSVRSHGGKVFISEIKADRLANLDPALRKAVAAEEVVRSVDDAREAVSFIIQVLAEEGAAPPEGKAIDLGMTRMAGEILKAKERGLRIAERKRQLVPLAAVKTHVERAFIGLRQAIQRMPSRHAGAIAAELGCDARALDAAMSRAIAAELEVLSAPVVRADGPK